MNYKKTAACICALFLMGTSALPYNGNRTFITSAYTQSSESSQIVSFTAAGEIKKLVLSGTTETPTWYSDNTNVATVDSEGNITAVANGTAKVYAVFSNQVLEFTVIVEIPDEQTEIIVGSVELTTLKPNAVASLAGAENVQAVWSSSDTSVATVDNNGNITAVGSGQCIITAVIGSIKYIVNVTSTYNPNEVPEVSIGSAALSNDKPSTKIVLTGVPEGETVVWSSSDTSVAAVDQNGNVIAVGSGECKIIANIGGVNYVTALTSSYDSSAAPKEIILGELTLTSENYSSTVTLSGVPEGTVIVWSSSDNSVAAVDQKGNVTAVGKGECKIYAYIGGVNYVMNVTSTYERASINTESTELVGIGSTLQLALENSSGTPEWVSTNVNVATVDSNGVVTAVGEGEAVILAKLSGKVLSITITVKADAVVYGDADLNGEIGISDVVLVMSHASNKEKHPLSDKAVNNADVYQRGDGISVADALSIQKYIAQVITELPEK